MSQPPEDKKPDFSNFPRGAIGLKGLPVSRNARLPSIRSPRDLTLGSQPKRTFTPNIPVRREKKSIEVPKTSGESSSGISSNKNTPKSTPQRADKGRGRGRAKGFIQLDGSVFGEGIAPSQPKAFSRHRESATKSEFSSGRPYIKKEKSIYDIQNMEREMKNLLRDDFIDDGDDSSGDESMKPVIFPAKEIKEKIEENPESAEKSDENFQTQDFAKTMGFDVKKIEKFIKKEKMDEPEPIVQPDWSRVPKSEITELLTSRDTPFFLIQMPEVITTQTNLHPSNASENAESNEEKKNVTMLDSLPEGTIGKLQIMRSGHVRVKIGSLAFYFDDVPVKDLAPTKQELLSIRVNSDSSDAISLGDCEKRLILEPDVDSLMPDLKDGKF